VLKASLLVPRKKYYCFVERDAVCSVLIISRFVLISLAKPKLLFAIAHNGQQYSLPMDRSVDEVCHEKMKALVNNKQVFWEIKAESSRRSTICH
jgi:hypothetical protein